MVAAEALTIRPQGPGTVDAAIEVSDRVSADKPSKSAMKRANLALQQLGEDLTRLGPSELEALPLDERLLEAVIEARQMKSHSALRRQRQLIGKLMRTADADAIRAVLARQGQREREEQRRFHAAEDWRDRICAEGTPAVTAFAAETGRDGQSLQALVAELRSASDTQRRSISRRIFREVHDSLADGQARVETR